MKKWEYTSCRFTELGGYKKTGPQDEDVIIQLANNMGSEGWELVSVVLCDEISPRDVVAFFKREIPTPKTTMPGEDPRD